MREFRDYSIFFTYRGLVQVLPKTSDYNPEKKIFNLIYET